MFNEYPTKLAQRHVYDVVVNSDPQGVRWFYDSDLVALGYDLEFIKVYMFVRENIKLFPKY